MNLKVLRVDTGGKEKQAMEREGKKTERLKSKLEQAVFFGNNLEVSPSSPPIFSSPSGYMTDEMILVHVHDRIHFHSI